MDKKQMAIAGFAIFTVILFILENFSFGFLNTGINPFLNKETPSAAAIITQNGVAQFDATLRYYESYLISDNKLDEDQINRIKINNKVIDVTNSQQGYIIETKDRDSVFEVYLYLKTINITAKSPAIFGAPSGLNVKLGDGTIIQTVNNDRLVLRLNIEPTIKPGTKTELSMLAQVQAGEITDFQNMQFASSSISFNTTAIVKEINNMQTKIAIPWESRNSINITAIYGKYGNDSVSYNRIDSVVFNQSLGIDAIKEKKKLPYVTFVSDNMITVNQGFQDESKIKEDFQGLGTTFPDSIIYIRYNGTISLPFNRTTWYDYNLEVIDQQNKSLANINLTTNRKYAINDKLPVQVDAKISANQIKDLLSISVLNQTNP